MQHDIHPPLNRFDAGKFALEAVSESLAAEVADHGIAVNTVEPGYLRTDFLRPVSLGLPSSTSDAYPAVREMVEQHLAMPGTQLGDPAKAAAAIVAVATSGRAPLHQLLGSDSVSLATGRLQTLSDDFEAARALAVTTDVPATGDPSGRTVRT